MIQKKKILYLSYLETVKLLEDYSSRCTFQLQRLYNKPQNNKWKHQYGLYNKSNSPTIITPNLYLLKNIASVMK